MFKIFKFLILIIISLMILFFVLRVSFYEIGNLTGTQILLGEVLSPNDSYVLKIYKCEPGILTQSGKTIFIIGENNKKYDFPRNNILTGEKVTPNDDIFEMSGNFFPCGIVWQNDKSVLINLKHPLEWTYKDLYGHTSKMYTWKRDQWNDIKISYGVLDEKKYKNEIRISPTNNAL